ncbi:hypothetical protein FA10DRAFT_263592 [Acaromyces ingoldii]|uniref:Yeast cell wall synthesis Kre9/Knh1-like N-terminal domain-containing protein n=1 Tax=Acaromyces ingoldii TaxID=215250 RepID=A0A316YYD3_9BASI|nr:hypothetical protein FA10DRAFT_263592 [Acaromyces ingoldii]PWN92845.1 hypothetical protein FA10DRAFT_263592 [Acaromyces ingoldii]
MQPPVCFVALFSILFCSSIVRTVSAAPLFGFFGGGDGSSSAAAAPSPSPSGAGSPAGFTPLGSPTDVFSEGATCTASWTPDTSGAATWKNMSISLMTGSNLNMTMLATVATGLDGTNTAVTSYNYTCPQVEPTSAIYFLQYNHDGDQDSKWTTRFAITDPSGATVPPPNANQPDGGDPAVPWGEGRLVSAGNATTTSSSTPASSSTATAASSATPAAATTTAGGGLPPQEQMQSAFSAAFAAGTGPFTNADLIAPGGSLYRQKTNGASPAATTSPIGLGLSALAAGLGAFLIL